MCGDQFALSRLRNALPIVKVSSGTRGPKQKDYRLTRYERKRLVQLRRKLLRTSLIGWTTRSSYSPGASWVIRDTKSKLLQGARL